MERATSSRSRTRARALALVGVGGAMVASLIGCAAQPSGATPARAPAPDWSSPPTVAGASWTLVFPTAASAPDVDRVAWAAVRKDDDLSPRSGIGLAESRWPEQRPKELRRVPEIRSRWGRSY